MVPNLPVAPYDGPYDRDKVSGKWASESAHFDYSHDVETLAGDFQSLLDEVLALKDQLRHVSHVATRETCKLTVDAIVPLLSGVRDLLQIEASG